MDLSVVIPTYNQADLLRECLRSLTTQTLEPDRYEIVVVDDGSTDHTPAVIGEAQAGSRQVRSVRLPANRGRSAARNAGIAHAASPRIVFIDSDIIVRPDFLEWHLRTLLRNGPGSLSRGPVVLVPSAAAAQARRIPRVAGSPAYLDTANAALEKDILIRAGLFDEHFPGYGWEDFDLGLRLKRLGVRRAFCRQAAAFHVQPPVAWAALEDFLRKEEERARSAVYFYRKHPTMETKWLIQATSLHHLLYWLQAGCGLLTPDNVFTVTQPLQRAGLEGLAFLTLRGVLNRHYARALNVEFQHAAAQA